MIDVWEDRQPDEELTAYIKRKTNELYDSLPPEEEARKSRLYIRDAVFELNYNFFGYVATQTFINNNYINFSRRVLRSVKCGTSTGGRRSTEQIYHLQYFSSRGLAKS